MKRRKFISSGVLAFGGAVIGSGISRRAAAEEISKNLSASGGGYDLLVVSAGISGAFAALKAARSGLKVLVAERGMCPGRELADTFDLSLDPRGFDSWDGAFKEIFFPDGEKEEISQKGLFGERGAFVEGGNVAVLAGSVEKSLARTLVKNGVDIMFMTDVFGVFADSDSRVCGAALAAKQGTFAVKCSSIIDASEGNSLACALAGKEPKPQNAHFSLELFGAESGCPKNFEIDLGGRKIEAEFLRGRAGGGHGYLRVRVPEGARGFEEASRLLCAEILKNKKALPEALRGAKDFSFARACSYEYSRAENFPKLEGFFVAENLKPVRSCADVSALRASGEGAASLAAARKIGEPQKFFSFCGEIPAPKIGKNVEEFGAKLGLARLEIPEKAASEISCEVLVAGIGTGGVFALDAAAQSGADALGLEYFNDFGGTKSNGGVVGFYWCARGNPIIEQSVRDIAAMKALGFSGGSSEAAVCAKKLAGRGAVRGAIICGAQTDGGAFSAAYFCARSRLFRARAKVAVDCTGDADLAAFAKVPFRQGSARSGVPINFSRWNRRNPATIGKPTRLAGGDYGIVDVCSVADFQRAILLSFYESAFFGAYPQLTPRDSRRPEGEKTLDLRAALRGLKGSDIIAQAYTDYDPHSYPTGAFTRCAMLLPHFSHGYAVDIPYGCVVAKNVDGLLLGGRAISATHEAFQFTRMSGDVAVLGEVEGRIAAAAAKLGGHTKGFDVSAIVKRSRGLGYFVPDFGDRSEPSANELVQRLARNDFSALLWACLRGKGEMKALLEKTFPRSRSLELALALSWFGSRSGESKILLDLEKNFADELAEGDRSEYLELYWRGDWRAPYWNVNRDIAFLAMAGSDASDAAVKKILSRASAGGAPVRSKKSAYYAGRIDLVLVPNYNRIGSLCFYAERRPSADFAAGFERLLEDPNIGGKSTREQSLARYGLYGGILESFVASSAARCGSARGAAALARYLSDQHAHLRAFARSELCDIYGDDLGFDEKAWVALAEKNAGKVAQKISDELAFPF